MNRPERVHSLLSLSCFILLTACGPQVEKPEEEVRTFERRRPACETFCGAVLDPECGSEEMGIYEDIDHCIEYCVSEEAAFWFLQEDDTDACAETFTEHYECVESALCEERWILTNVPARASETPCLSTINAYGDCQREHRE
ncbi:MAG: hypothetical protein ACE37F_29785 [Nannocystaceae bacterium]|nr:hypothetical protein [bacterium]